MWQISDGLRSNRSFRRTALDLSAPWGPAHEFATTCYAPLLEGAYGAGRGLPIGEVGTFWRKADAPGFGGAGVDMAKRFSAR
jgi:hypothetical protein